VLLASGAYEYEDYSYDEGNSSLTGAFIKLLLVFVLNFILTGYLIRYVLSFFSIKYRVCLGVLSVIAIKFMISKRWFGTNKYPAATTMPDVKEATTCATVDIGSEEDQVYYLNESWTDSGFLRDDFLMEEEYHIDFDRNALDSHLEEKKLKTKRASMLPKV
jgi:hypothetical protein